MVHSRAMFAGDVRRYGWHTQVLLQRGVQVWLFSFYGGCFANLLRYSQREVYTYYIMQYI